MKKGYFQATFEDDENIHIEAITPTLFRTFEGEASTVHLDVSLEGDLYTLDFLVSNAPEDVLERLKELAIDIANDFRKTSEIVKANSTP